MTNRRRKHLHFDPLATYALVNKNNIVFLLDYCFKITKNINRHCICLPQGAAIIRTLLFYARWIFILVVALALVACSQSIPTPSPADERVADLARPADAELAQKYERSCLTCHASIASNAPLTGFEAHWEPRLRQSMPTLVAHVRDGFQGMPARGYCNDCSDHDFEALVVFMSHPPLSKE